MRIDYSKSTFRLFAGDGVEITDFVDSIKIGVPDPDPGQILTWQGQIEISRNLKAVRSQLPHAYFDPVSFPLRWRPDRPFRLELMLDGSTAVIPLRVQKYAYKKVTGKGTANLVQILDSIAKERPAESPEFKVDRANGADIAIVIKSLIAMAYKSISLPVPTVLLPGIWGKFEDSIATRNPINDAADMGASCWQFMRVLSDESIEFRSLDPMAYPVLLRRYLGSIEFDPDMNTQVDWKSKTIVTGHYQKAAVPECAERSGSGFTIVRKEGLDEKNRPAFMTTRSSEYTSIIEVNGQPGAPRLIPGETKTILTEYGDSTSNFTLRRLWQRVSDGASTSILGDPVNTLNPNIVLDEIPVIPRSKCGTGVVGTITITSQVFEVIFPDVPSGSSRGVLYASLVEIQTDRKKVTFKPAGIASRRDGELLLNLVITRREEVADASAHKATVTEGGAIDPNDPSKGVQCLEDQPCPEERQVMPDFKMQTVPVRAECAIAPQGWEPLVKLPLIQDMGFIPSQAHGNALACQVAARHVRRGNGHTCEMPIAPEWIAANCPPTFRFHYDDAEYEAVAITIEISVTDKGSIRKMTCDALRVGAAPIVIAPPAQEPYLPIGFQIVSPSAIIGFAGDTFQAYQITIAV